MRRIIDLSLKISNGFIPWPDEPAVEIKPLSNSANEYTVSQITFSSHTGTHIDVPGHCLKSKANVGDLDLHKCIGEAFVIHVEGKGAREEINVAELRKIENKIKEGAKILIRTDWSKKFGRKEYFTDFPGISQELAEWLANKHISLLGIEQPSVHTTKHLKVHRTLLQNGVVVVEGLTNLSQLKKEEIYLVILPLKLDIADGSPVRAIAMEE
jgi:arylformamidase